MFPIDSNSLYLMWLNRIVESHLKRDWDQYQTAADEEKEEWFNDHWRELAETHRHRLWGLSADLNTLHDKETYVERDWTPMTEDELRRQQSEAFAKKDWDRLLDSLRRPPRFRPREDTDYARGRAWMELGHPEVALLFFDNASRLNPRNLAFPSLALECLKLIPDWNQALTRAERYRQKQDTPARLLFRAGDVYHVIAYHLGDPTNYEKAVEVADRGLTMLAEGASHETISSVIAGAYATKALSLEHLGRPGQALEVFNEAIARFPENTTLITARGLLKQQLGDAAALEDFREAVAGGTALVWPYLELARDALRHGQYKTVPGLCRRGLDCNPREAVAALLFQLTAIALFNLGDASDAVEAAFDAAFRTRSTESRNPYKPTTFH